MRVGNRSWAGLARLLGDDDGVARRLLAAKYQGWREGEPMSKWAQSALLIEIEPTASPEQL